MRHSTAYAQRLKSAKYTDRNSRKESYLSGNLTLQGVIHHFRVINLLAMAIYLRYVEFAEAILSRSRVIESAVAHHHIHEQDEVLLCSLMLMSLHFPSWQKAK